jgi:hypothetical protein
VKPAAAAASCRSPEEVDIKTEKGRDFQRERRISKTRYRAKEHGQYGSKGEIDLYAAAGYPCAYVRESKAGLLERIELSGDYCRT